MKFTVVFFGKYGEYTRDLYAADLEDLGNSIDEIINCDIVDDEIEDWEVLDSKEDWVAELEAEGFEIVEAEEGGEYIGDPEADYFDSLPDDVEFHL